MICGALPSDCAPVACESDWLDDEFESSTVNGWLSELCGHIPQVGECAQYRNLTVRVTAGDDLMTHEAEVTVKNEPQIPTDAGTETKTD